MKETTYLRNYGASHQIIRVTGLGGRIELRSNLNVAMFLIGSEQSWSQYLVWTAQETQVHFRWKDKNKRGLLCSEAPYLKLWTWAANQDHFSVSKGYRSSWHQKGVSFLLMKFQTPKFLMVYHFREQGFSVSQKVVTQRRGWLWHFSYIVPLEGLFHGNFVPMSVLPAWWNVRVFS